LLKFDSDWNPVLKCPRIGMSKIGTLVIMFTHVSLASYWGAVPGVSLVVVYDILNFF